MLLEEVLLLIFDKLPLTDLLQCSLVSRSWFSIINNNVKLRNKMKLKLNGNTYNEYHQLANKIQRTHSSLMIEGVYFYDYRASRFTNIQHLSLKFCFIGSVQNFKRIIEGWPNLQTLKLLPIAFEPVVAAVMPSSNPSSMPRSLKHLEITLFPNIVDSENAWNVIRCFELIPMQVQNIHLKLRSVYNVGLADNLRNILSYTDEKHGASVKKLAIKGYISVGANQVIYEHLVGLENVHMEYLDIGTPPDFELFKAFLRNQTSLKHLSVEAIPLLTRSQLHWICDSLQNLVILDLGHIILDEINLDKLISLEDLRLSFSNPPSPITVTIPTGLRHLSVKCETEFADINLVIVGDMRKIEELCLKYCNLTLMFLENSVPNMTNLKTFECVTMNNESVIKISSYLLLWTNLTKLVLSPWMMNNGLLSSIRSMGLKTFDIKHDFGQVDIENVSLGLQHLGQNCPLLHQIYDLRSNALLYKRIQNDFVKI